MMSMPQSVRFVSSVRRISPDPPPNSVWNASRKLLVDGLERFGEFLARYFVDLLDRFLGVADGIEQVLPLRAQEIVALLALLEFLERLRIDRPQRFDARADLVVLPLGFASSASPSGSSFVGRHQFVHARSPAPCGWSRPGYFNSACFFTSSTSISERF